MIRKVIVIGAGGHAGVVVDLLLRLERHVVAMLDPDTQWHGRAVMGIPVVGGDSELTRWSPTEVELALGVGSVRPTTLREALFSAMRAQGYSFTTLVHPWTAIGLGVTLGEGVQVMAGAVLQTGASIADNTIINTHASVDHECRIGSHVHIAPGATLSGGVHVGDGAHIGAGAVVLQGLTVGAGSLVGAGALVNRDVPPYTTVYGVPAREA